MSPLWDLSLGFIIENSSLQPEVENATGNFLRTAILTNIKYRFPVSTSGMINFGGGIGYYFPSDLDVDMSGVEGGAHNIFGYENTIGFQLQVEYEGIFYTDLYWSIGLKYYYVMYDINSAKSNGINIPVDQLPFDVSDPIGKLNGSGIDLVLSLNYYF